ncbi:hypothetical protein [Microbispora sp. H11081]|uniref:hypothetical protein n=1 Tax=Microbispora sp. H11081 TaxID=2729107 RepID=UPI0014746999|nr:hypothetical protein [Microbispora sp. H11081]
MTTTSAVSKENVEVGLELPPLHFDVSLTTLAKDVAGTRDIYEIHHNSEFAKANGARDMFLNTMWYQGLLGRYLTDWAGSNSFVRKIGFDMRGTNCPGDHLVVRGKVTGVRSEDARTLVDLDVSIDNQLQKDTVVARVTVELG